MFKKLLIANRGEIALRILRACKELDIKTVAVHSTADKDAMYVRMADEAVCIGGPASKDSYLNIPALLTVAELTNVDAIHPGIGFLSERAGFAETVEESGYCFIGPTAQHINVMGDKVAAKAMAIKLGLPVVPGGKGALTGGIEEAKKLADEFGYPIIVKASAGGGGRGMKVAHNVQELADAVHLCSKEAKAAFGDDSLYLEKFLQNPRHIELQVIGDGKGGAIHLGERDCSIQRRHQKVIEEALSPVIDCGMRSTIGNTVIKAMSELNYRGVGTIEFLYDSGQFYFIEMNTRLQVEHPVTEEITGIDLVKKQIEVAATGELGISQGDIGFDGHSIQCRINAEHAETFMPSPGLVKWFHAPGGLGIRFDSHLYAGYQVPPYYDNLVGKLIVHGADRTECITRALRALDETVIEGIETNIDLHTKILTSDPFKNGDYDVNWLEHWLK